MDTLSPFRSSRIVKLARRFTFPFAVFIILMMPTRTIQRGPFVWDLVDTYYSRHLREVQLYLNELKSLCKQQKKIPELRKVFEKLRLSYKKVAILTDYFNPYETAAINFPAISRVEEDNPDIIIPPRGLQMIEQLLYEKNTLPSMSRITEQVDRLSVQFTKLEQEPGRELKFRPVLVWDALRSATLGIMTNGITGFDSPLAKLSLREAAASLKGLRELLILLSKQSPANGSGIISRLLQTLDAAINYVSRYADFDSFDRLTFITRYMDPFYGALVKARDDLQIGVPEGHAPFNYRARSIFAPDAFDINFYGPASDYWVSEDRVKLGKRLFFDPVLSKNKDRSCASCHQPAKAFTDNLKTPLAIDNITQLKRNTPTLWNAGLQTRQFYDSHADILENQLDDVVHNTLEMGGSLKELVSQVKNDPLYFSLFKKAYPSEPDPVTPFLIGNAVSSYVRSLISLGSRYDKYMRGDRGQLSEPEKRGFNLFAGKGKCATCHFIPLFNGLVAPFYTETESEVIGVPLTKDKHKPVLDPDEGKFGFTRSEIHKFSFKTPTLRNIALTAPYMHNGAFNTLEEVVDFYNDGGGKGLKIDPPNQTLPFDKLSLSAREKADIVAFLRSLTDTSAVH